jgi:hypothetical protein
MYGPKVLFCGDIAALAPLIVHPGSATVVGPLHEGDTE